MRSHFSEGRLALAAALIYLLGAFGVTTLFNVPLNGEIAPLDPARPENAQAMVSFIDGMDAVEPPPHPREPYGVRSSGLEFAFWVGAGGRFLRVRGERSDPALARIDPQEGSVVFRPSRVLPLR